MMANGNLVDPTGARRRAVGLDTIVKLGIPLHDLELDADRVEAYASGEDAAPIAGAAGERLGALAALAVRDAAPLVLLATMPDASRALGSGATILGFSLLLSILVGPALAFALAGRLHGRSARARALLLSLAVLPLVLVATSLAPTGAAILGLYVLAGLAGGVVEATALPLSVDGAEGGAATGARDAWLARGLGASLVLVLVGLATGPLGATWRGAFLLVSLPAIGATILAGARLRATTATSSTVESDAHRLGSFELLRRLSLMPTSRRAMSSSGVLGLLIAPTLVFGLAVLDRRVGLHFSSRAIALGVAIGLGALLGAVAVRQLADDGQPHASVAGALPRLLVGGAALLVFATVLSGSLAVVALLAVVLALAVAAGTALTGAAFEVTSRAAQPVAVAASMTFFGPVGIVGSLVLTSSVDRRFGAGVALAMGSVALVALARSVARLSREVEDDTRRSRSAMTEEAELVARGRAGLPVPMLTCRSIDFSYGQLQVLFGVDFTVDEGEMVALLGTNGAGKSTLLRVISGLGLPSGGRVHFGGQDITYLDPERRVGQGIAQIPGGKAVFGPMSVVENLRVFGHTVGRSPRELDAGIEATLAAFPRLDERRNQPASTLSGGEQQMLALGKALIVKPRLLLIDELSLGLAPIIVGQLLEMVREINATGTAVVLVEQSVNVALSLVDHAYFMEKGQIRFDGKASELLDRRDLLRSVFLEGVGDAA